MLWLLWSMRSRLEPTDIVIGSISSDLAFFWVGGLCCGSTLGWMISSDLDSSYFEASVSFALNVLLLLCL